MLVVAVVVVVVVVVVQPWGEGLELHVEGEGLGLQQWWVDLLLLLEFLCQTMILASWKTLLACL